MLKKIVSSILRRIGVYLYFISIIIYGYIWIFGGHYLLSQVVFKFKPFTIVLLGLIIVLIPFYDTTLNHFIGVDRIQISIGTKLYMGTCGIMVIFAGVILTIHDLIGAIIYYLSILCTFLGIIYFLMYRFLMNINKKRFDKFYKNKNSTKGVID